MRRLAERKEGMLNTSLKAFITSGLILVMMPFSLFAATSTQLVTINLTEAYQGIVALRVFNGIRENPPVNFYDSYQGTWEVSDAGLPAYTSPYARFESLGEKWGGSLQYTVANQGDKIITVHSPTSSYNSNSLYVSLETPRGYDGSTPTNGQLGVVSFSGNSNTPNTFLIPYGSGNAVAVISDIPGNDTYTGAEKGVINNTDYVPGAYITYGFAGDPGVTTIEVVYTILDMGDDGDQEENTSASF